MTGTQPQLSSARDHRLHSSAALAVRIIATGLIVLCGLVGCRERPSAPDRSESDPGLPPINRVWGAADYRKVATLIDERAIPLPGMGDATGSAAFDRLTNVENLAFLRDETIGVNVRFKDWHSISDSTKAIARRYFAQLKAEGKYAAELLSLIGFQLQIIAQGQPILNRAHELIKKASKNSPRVEEEVEAMRQFARDGLFVAVGSLEETELYDAKSRARMLATLVETAPRLFPLLSREERQELATRLQAMKTPDALLVVHKNVDALLRSLNN